MIGLPLIKGLVAAFPNNKDFVEENSSVSLDSKTTTLSRSKVKRQSVELGIEPRRHKATGFQDQPINHSRIQRRRSIRKIPF